MIIQLHIKHLGMKNENSKSKDNIHNNLYVTCNNRTDHINSSVTEAPQEPKTRSMWMVLHSKVYQDTEDDFTCTCFLI